MAYLSLGWTPITNMSTIPLLTNYTNKQRKQARNGHFGKYQLVWDIRVFSGGFLVWDYGESGLEFQGTYPIWEIY